VCAVYSVTPSVFTPHPQFIRWCSVARNRFSRVLILRTYNKLREGEGIHGSSVRALGDCAAQIELPMRVAHDTPWLPTRVTIEPMWFGLKGLPIRH
jgi:hypothetical protein